MNEFGEWLPDLPPYDNPGLITATNVLPGDNSYLPLFAPAKVSESQIEGNALGAISVVDKEDASVAHNFVGTSSKLYLMSDSAFSDVSKSGGYGATGPFDKWEFAQVGNDIIATDFEDNIQTYTIGTSSQFADLGGSPPKARHVAKIGRFLVIANINDTTDGFVPQRVQWAGIGTTDSWTVDASTQADFQDLDNNHGWIQGIVGGEYGGVIFQETGIVRMTYAGSPLVFQFDVVNTLQGALVPSSIINLGDMVAFLSQEGFYVFDGNTAVAIGTNKVNDFFFDDVDRYWIDTMSSSVYPDKSICAWSYRSKDAKKRTSEDSSMNDTILFYNYDKNAKKRWSIYRVEHSIIFPMLTEGWTLDELDNYPPGSQTLEKLEESIDSLDSRVLMGGKRLFSVIDSQFRLSPLTGDTEDADILTGETQIFPGKRAQVNRIRPYVDYDDGSATLLMRIGTRENLKDSVTFTNSLDLTNSGYATSRSTGRYHRFNLIVSGNYRAIQGFDVLSAAEQGSR